MRLRTGLCIALAAGATLAGCRRSAPPTPTPEPAQIVFAYPSGVLTPYLEDLERSFEEENPRLDVVLRQTNPYNALTSATQRADVAMIDQLSIALLADAGALRPLDPLLQGTPELDLSVFYEGTLAALTWQGQLWGLPADVDPWVLYYNKDLFDASGVPYPTNNWTWDDMLEAALRITDPTASPPLYGILGDMNRADFVPLVYQNGGALVDSLVAPTTVSFTDPAAVEAVEWYVSLALTYGVMPTPRELSQMGGLETAVVTQRGAMWYGPLSERGGTLSSTPWPFEWGLVAQPGNRARMTLLGMRTYVLSSNSERPTVAWEWLRYLATRPPVAFTVPPIKAVAESAEYLAAQRPDVAEAALLSMQMGHTMPPTIWIDQVGGWLIQALQQVFQEQLSVADALASVQEKAEPLLAAEREP